VLESGTQLRQPPGCGLTFPDDEDAVAEATESALDAAQLPRKLFVKCFMVADPKPGDSVLFQQPNRSVVSRYSNGPKLGCGDEAVKLKAGVRGIGSKLLVSSNRRTTDFDRQCPVQQPKLRNRL
jgi:hypothetical protein